MFLIIFQYTTLQNSSLISASVATTSVRTAGLLVLLMIPN